MQGEFLLIPPRLEKFDLKCMQMGRLVSHGQDIQPSRNVLAKILRLASQKIGPTALKEPVEPMDGYLANVSQRFFSQLSSSDFIQAEIQLSIRPLIQLVTPPASITWRSRSLISKLAWKL